MYQALDMGMPGILGYKSICNGNTPYEVPDFRDKAVREQYRNDTRCTNPAIAGDQLAPLLLFRLTGYSGLRLRAGTPGVASGGK